MADAEAMAEKLEGLSVSGDAGGVSFAGLKKKKKKKQVEEEPVEEPEASTATAATESSVEASAGVDGAEAGETVEALGLAMKKKKKKKVRYEDAAPPEVEDEDGEVPTGEGADVEEVEEAEAIELGPKYPWEGTTRDYTYEELLGRVFGILRANNPELGEKRRTIMKPPQVLREGTKKTVFVNFMDLCKTMHRSPEHVMAFLLAELGTNGSLDGQQRLMVKGRFLPKQFEGILRRYVNEYVMCSGCKSPDTILSKENRLFFLRCEQCGSSRSVAPIKAGFVARVGRRKAT